MRARVLRQLGAFFQQPRPPVTILGFQAEAADRRLRLVAATEDVLCVPPELTPHQYAILLLHVAAEIEHALMVEYLYAAYTLGGPQVPVEQRENVAKWQEVINGIAKEEMGHLMTVQNLLRALGGPLNLDREDYPWDSEFLPYPFRLEPLMTSALARFIIAESPANWATKEAEEIRKLARQGLKGDVRLHRVGELYGVIRKLIADPNMVPDSSFRASTLPYQANWDEWGRGYRGGARGTSKGSAMPKTPDVLLLQVTSRTDALAAIDAIATQGEANPTDSENEPSHFARFLSIYKDFPKGSSWAIRPAPLNPYVASDLQSNTGQNLSSENTAITHPEARLWASLFNVRYCMLLTNLLHTFDYPGSLDQNSQMSPRGLLIHSTFGEMYNLRAISSILVQTPLNADDPGLVAGPPFQMPFTLKRPVDASDRWHLHLDLIESSKHLINMLRGRTPQSRHAYLDSLRGGDEQLGDSIQRIINGVPGRTSSCCY